MSTTNNPIVDPVVGFDALIGQEKQIEQLTSALRSDCVPHAMLFTGEDGIGKKTAAINFAMACNCQTGMNIIPCGACRSCRNIISGNHPDFHYIRASGAHIRIDQIRALCRSLALKPYAADVRVVLLSDAHLMNAESGNALLKVLEEPPVNTRFILTAPRAADLLPTIVSRCRHIRFSPISQHQLEVYLVRNFQVDNENAAVIASLAGGSIGRALSIRNEDWVRRRNWIIEKLECMGGETGISLFVFTEMLALRREKLAYAFEIMKNWFRDLAVFKYAPEGIVNRDLKHRIATASKRVSLERLVQNAGAVEDAERAIAANGNVRLALDALAIKLSSH